MEVVGAVCFADTASLCLGFLGGGLRPVPLQSAPIMSVLGGCHAQQEHKARS